MVAIEEVFHAANVQSAIKLGQARGVALLAAGERHLPVFEYSALEIELDCRVWPRGKGPGPSLR